MLQGSPIDYLNICPAKHTNTLDLYWHSDTQKIDMLSMIMKKKKQKIDLDHVQTDRFGWGQKRDNTGSES